MLPVQLANGLLALLGIATLAASGVTAGGGFREKCHTCFMSNGTGWYPNGHLLTCTCRTSNPLVEVVSEIDLNHNLGNRDGQLIWDSNHYLLTCPVRWLHGGHLYVARCFMENGEYNFDGNRLWASAVELNDAIGVDDLGRLSLNGKLSAAVWVSTRPPKD